MSAQVRPLRRLLQFRITSLLGLMAGIAIGFAPLKLWEVWRKPSPQVFVRMEFIDVDRAALASLRQADLDAGSQPAIAKPALRESLEILKHSGKATALSCPQLMTLDGQAATVQVGRLVPAATSGGPLQFDGIYYEVTPKQQRNGRIHLAYTINVKSPADAVNLLCSARIDVGQNEPVVLASHSAGATISDSTRETIVLLSAETANGLPAPPAGAMPQPARATSAMPAR